MRKHPYERFTESPQWTVIDRAVCELAQNRDLVETTQHDYIVGYLCQALDTSLQGSSNVKASRSRVEALGRLRQAVKQANPSNRDLVKELVDERRLEALGE